MMVSKQDKFYGLLLGTAVGDSLGLPMEGMRPKTIERLDWANELKQRLVFGQGMWSDDTEHTIMLAQALLKSGGDEELFLKSFAWELRWWLLAFPAGVGLATARSLLKLWLGFSPKNSGVFSAGNGPAMRAAVVGAFYCDAEEKRRAFTLAHTKITHADPKAWIGAMAVADLAAHFMVNDGKPPEAEEVLTLLKSCGEIDFSGAKGSEEAQAEWLELLEAIRRSLKEKHQAKDFHKMISRHPEKGVSGYIYESLAVVVFTGQKEGWDMKKMLPEIYRLGGDTDTVGAIAGALAGVYGGSQHVPREWIVHLAEWPCGQTDLHELAEALQSETSLRLRAKCSPLLLCRNVYFLSVVLAHGFMRLFLLRR